MLHRPADWSEDLGEALSEEKKGPPVNKKCRENPGLCLYKAVLCDDPMTKDTVRRQCPITCGVSGCGGKGVHCRKKPSDGLQMC